MQSLSRGPGPLRARAVTSDTVVSGPYRARHDSDKTCHSLVKNDPLRMWPSSAKTLDDVFAGAEAKVNSSVVADHSICAWLRMNLPVKS